jgi:uncharacterized protein YndB with AHSA1/START domain
MRDDVLTIERRFAAPVARVYGLWTDPALVRQWWGPKGRKLSHCEMDFRIGGAWRFCLKRQSDGHEHWVHGVYRDIRPEARLVFSYVNDSDGRFTLVTVDFEAEGAGTLMRFRQEGFASVDQRDGHGFGWSSTFDLLGEHLQGLERVD